MLRLMPPIEAAEAFLAAARSPSFRAAAASIAISPSAFSRRIQALEAFTGVPLFDRTAQASRLTPSGERYLAEVAPALEAIRRATLDLRERRAGSPLKVATSHSFAAEWLMPRLRRLRDEIGVEILITASRDPQLVSNGDVDLAIWAGTPNSKSLAHEQIVALDGAFAAAPAVVRRKPLPTGVADLRSERLLVVRANLDMVESWLDQLSLTGTNRPDLAVFETNQLAYEAAAAGVGVAIAVPLLSDRFIADGRLLRATTVRAATGCHYVAYFADERTLKRRNIRQLLDWLRREARASITLFNAWHGSYQLHESVTSGQDAAACG